MRLTRSPCTEELEQVFAKPPGEALRLFWLGQAGFVIDAAGLRLVIDPYLSDSLAAKYRGHHFPHERMMAVPVASSAIRHVSAVLATHAHTDHLDPGTLPALMAANPLALLVAPRAARAVALERAAIDASRFRGINAGERLYLEGLSLTAVRAAHEALERDADGHYRFLGLAMKLGGVTVFHSGDTIPFEGQAEEATALAADIALLPVNGRDSKRADNGIPGNMDVDEALALCRAAGIRNMIAHHFGLFAFNTVPRDGVIAATEASAIPDAVAAETGVVYGLAQDRGERTA